jgi:hypothetical protein
MANRGGRGGSPEAFGGGAAEGSGSAGRSTADSTGIIPPSAETFTGTQQSAGTTDSRSDMEKYGVETQVIQHDRGSKIIRKYHPETGEEIPKRPTKYVPKWESDPDGNRIMPSEEIDRARKSDSDIAEWDKNYKVVSKLPAARSTSTPKNTSPTGATSGSQPVPTAKVGEIQTALGSQIAALRAFHSTSAQTVHKSGDEAAQIYHHALGQALDLASAAHKAGVSRMSQRAPQYASEHFQHTADIIAAAHGFASSEPMSRIAGAPPVSADEVSAWGAHAGNAIVPRRTSFSYNRYTLGTRKTADTIRAELVAQGRHEEAAKVTNSFDPRDMDADSLVQLGKSLGMKSDTLDWKNGSNINQGVLKAAVAGQGANQGVRIPPLERKESEARGEATEVADPLTGDKMPYATEDNDVQFNPEATTGASSNLGARGEGLRVGTYQPPSGPGETPREGEARYESERNVSDVIPGTNIAQNMETRLVATGLPETHPQAAASQAAAAERNPAPITAADVKSGNPISGDAEITPEVQREIQRQRDRKDAADRTQARFDARWSPEEQAAIRAKGEQDRVDAANAEAQKAVDESNAKAADVQASVDKTMGKLKERKPRKRGK